MRNSLNIDMIPDSILNSDLKQKFIDMGAKSSIEVLCLLTVSQGNNPQLFDLSEMCVETIVKDLKAYIQGHIGEKALNDELKSWEEIRPSDYGMGLDKNGKLGGKDGKS